MLDRTVTQPNGKDELLSIDVFLTAASCVTPKKMFFDDPKELQDLNISCIYDNDEPAPKVETASIAVATVVSDLATSAATIIKATSVVSSAVATSTATIIKATSVAATAVSTIKTTSTAAAAVSTVKAKATSTLPPLLISPAPHSCKCYC